LKIKKEEGWRGDFKAEQYRHVRVGTCPGQDLRAFAGFKGKNSWHASFLSLHSDVTRIKKAWMPPVARPRYPITDWTKFHSFQLILAATEGREHIPRIR
jgi:hypothetical protein